jgi:hypothetical protein
MKEKGPPALTNRRRGGKFMCAPAMVLRPRFSKQNLVNVPRSDHQMSNDLYVKYGTREAGLCRVAEQVTHCYWPLSTDDLFYSDWLSLLAGPAQHEVGTLPDFTMMKPYGSRNIEPTPPGYVYCVRLSLLVQGHGLVWWTAAENSHVGRVLTRWQDDYFASQEAREAMLPLHQIEESSWYENRNRHKVYYSPVAPVIAYRPRDTLRLPPLLVVVPSLLEGPQSHPDDDLFPQSRGLFDGSEIASKPPRTRMADLNDEIPW